MSNEVEVYERLMQIGEAQKFSTVFGANSEQAQKIAEHTARTPQHRTPLPGWCLYPLFQSNQARELPCVPHSRFQGHLIPLPKLGACGLLH